MAPPLASAPATPLSHHVRLHKIGRDERVAPTSHGELLSYSQRSRERRATSRRHRLHTAAPRLRFAASCCVAPDRDRHKAHETPSTERSHAEEPSPLWAAAAAAAAAAAGGRVDTVSANATRKAESHAQTPLRTFAPRTLTHPPAQPPRKKKEAFESSQGLASQASLLPAPRQSIHPFAARMYVSTFRHTKEAAPPTHPSIESLSPRPPSRARLNGRTVEPSSRSHTHAHTHTAAADPRPPASLRVCESASLRVCESASLQVGESAESAESVESALRRQPGCVPARPLYPQPAESTAHRSLSRQPARRQHRRAQEPQIHTKYLHICLSFAFSRRCRHVFPVVLAHCLPLPLPTPTHSHPHTHPLPHTHPQTPSLPASPAPPATLHTLHTLLYILHSTPPA